MSPACRGNWIHLSQDLTSPTPHSWSTTSAILAWVRTGSGPREFPSR